MSDMRVKLKDDEVYCFCCHGYGGYPSDPRIPVSPKTIGKCSLCHGAGKYKKEIPRSKKKYGFHYDTEDDLWDNWAANYRAPN